MENFKPEGESNEINSIAKYVLHCRIRSRDCFWRYPGADPRSRCTQLQLGQPAIRRGNRRYVEHQDGAAENPNAGQGTLYNYAPGQGNNQAQPQQRRGTTGYKH